MTLIGGIEAYVLPKFEQARRLGTHKDVMHFDIPS